MRSALFLLMSLGVLGLAFWAYRENYATQGAIKDMAKIQREIRQERENLAVLQAEWAYLNRPDYLQDLVNLNFDALKLVPITSDQFVEVGQIAYARPRPALDSGLILNAPDAGTNDEVQ